MGITFIVLCILCIIFAVYIVLGEQGAEYGKVNAERAKVWVYIAAVILALGHFWPS